MRLHIPISEASALIKAKTDKPVVFRIVNSNTIAVGYDVKVRVPLLGEISKQIEINLQIEKIQDEVLYMRCASNGLGLIIKGVLTAFPTFSTSDIIEVDGERQVKVHLREIEKLRDVLDKVIINTISFENDYVVVDFCLKEV